MTALDVYVQFVLDYAPYLYYIPGSGVDTDAGQAVASAGFAIDLLYECYNDVRFTSQKTDIYNKIIALADWILTQQCVDNGKDAYGGFKSDENSDYYYSIDACRVIPSLLKAYELTDDSDYLDAAKLAATFLKSTQDKQSYGGFAKFVQIDDTWDLKLEIECLYGLIGLKMLAETYDTQAAATYESMMSKAVSFLRSGFENLWLYYDPSDSEWHRTGTSEHQILDDVFAYALLGLFNYEAWSVTCEKVYESLNSIGPSAEYPGYNPAVCWSGYIDVVKRKAACEYYDCVTAGILQTLQVRKDKPSVELSYMIATTYYEEFMFWGAKFADWSYQENKQSTITVSWLGLMLLNYKIPGTRFSRILEKFGENLALFSIVENSDSISYLDPINVKGICSSRLSDETLIEPGFTVRDLFTLFTFVPIRQNDKIMRAGVEYEVGPVQKVRARGEPIYFMSVCRRFISE